MHEVEAAPKQVEGPCLLNVVRNGKTPEVTFSAALDMGYAIAIVPGLLFTTVIGACDQALAALKADDKHPVPVADLSPAQAFARAGSEAWEPRRTKYRPGTSSTAANAAD